MQLFLQDGSYIITSEGVDCSIPLSGTPENPRAWYVDAPKIAAVMTDDWTGSVADGGSVNFRNIQFNPHGHGTHTECLGHITPTVHSVNGVVREAFMKTLLVSVTPESFQAEDGKMDLVIRPHQLEQALFQQDVSALMIRTLPNLPSKKSLNYSDTNPTYLDVSIVELLNNSGIKHLLVDLPSVDREQDGGKLLFHHAFWGVPENPRFDRTITELIFVPEELEDGVYLMNLETAPFENDATPSRPVLFPLHQTLE